MIDVYVREVSQEKGQFFGSFEPKEIPQLPILFKENLTLLENGNYAEYDTSYFKSSSGVYFVILVKECE